MTAPTTVTLAAPAGRRRGEDLQSSRRRRLTAAGREQGPLAGSRETVDQMRA
jgi:hypothetical protein